MGALVPILTARLNMKLLATANLATLPRRDHSNHGDMNNGQFLTVDISVGSFVGIA